MNVLFFWVTFTVLFSPVLFFRVIFMGYFLQCYFPVCYLDVMPKFKTSEYSPFNLPPGLNLTSVYPLKLNRTLKKQNEISAYANLR